LQTRYFLFICPQCVISTFRPGNTDSRFQHPTQSTLICSLSSRFVSFHGSHSYRCSGVSGAIAGTPQGMATLRPCPQDNGWMDIAHRDAFSLRILDLSYLAMATRQGICRYMEALGLSRVQSSVRPACLCGNTRLMLAFNGLLKGEDRQFCATGRWT
jgi:hypothetical protein